MKRMILIVTLLALASVIMLSTDVSRAGTPQLATTDTLSMPVWPEDSLGSPVALAADDSLYLTCKSPSGIVVYSDSVLGNSAELKEHTWEDQPSDYDWPKLVSTLDGSATTYGVYTVQITVMDISLDLPTRFRYSFQKISANLDVLLARLDADITTRSSHAATAIVSGGAITTSSGAVSTVTNVGTVTGNVDGSVASVTGAVGSVTGNVGGNVVGNVASVTGNVGGIAGTLNQLDDLNDVAATDIVSGGAVTTSGGAVSTVTNVGTVTGNVDGSTASVTGNVGGNVVGTVASVVGNVGGIAGTKNQLDDLNDIAATAIVSGGAITTSSGAVTTVTSVTNGVTVTTNNDKTAYVLAINGLDTDSSMTNLQAQVNQVYIWVTDSSFVQFGFSGRTITPWAKPNASGSGDRDTLFYGAVPSDTLGGVEYFHVGGAAWDDADSIKTFIWP